MSEGRDDGVVEVAKKKHTGAKKGNHSGRPMNVVKGKVRRVNPYVVWRGEGVNRKKKVMSPNLHRGRRKESRPGENLGSRETIIVGLAEEK